MSLGPAYRRLWTSSGLSNLADGILKVALPLAAVEVTRSPPLIAGLAFAVTLPWLLFALPAGALADRLDRRRAMLGANAVRVVLVAGLAVAVLLDAGSIAVLYVVAFGVGATETLYDTSAQSIVPQLVGRDHLARANGRLYAVEITTNQFVGPPLAGALVTAGVAAVFAAPAALWLAAALALLLVRGSFRPERTASTTLRTEVAEGLRFLWRHRVLRTAAVMVGGFNFASNAAAAVLVLYAVGPDSAVGLSAEGYGLLLTTVAAGSLLGSFAAERVERVLGRARALAVSFLTGALLIGMPALTTNPVLIGAAFVLGGVGLVVCNVVLVSLRQRVTPDRLLGRVNSGYRLVAWGTMPLGAAVGGLLAEVAGLRAVFAVTGVLALLLLAGLTVLTDDAMDAAEAAVR